MQIVTKNALDLFLHTHTHIKKMFVTAVLNGLQKVAVGWVSIADYHID